MMGRALGSRVRRLGFLALCLALALAAAAYAAKPKHNAHFKGSVAGAGILGFKAPVTFTVAPNGAGLNNFVFGSFGCFGAGGFRPGVNPYTGNSLIHAGKVKVSSSGKFSQTGLAGYTVSGQTSTFTITIAGRFTTPKKATGTILYTEHVSGGGVNSSCGPATLDWTASAH